MRTRSIWALALLLLLFSCGEATYFTETADLRPGADEAEELDQGTETAALYRELFGTPIPDRDLPRRTEPLIASWTKVADEALIDSLLEVHPDRLIFERGHSLLEELEVMDIFVSGHPDAPFLRRVLEVNTENGLIVVSTMGANIEDFMLEGDFSLDQGGPTDVAEDVRELRQPMQNMDRLNPNMQGKSTSEVDISLGLNVTYPSGPPRVRSKFDLSVDLSQATNSWFSYKKQFCEDFSAADNSNNPMMMLTWTAYWGGTATRMCGYRCCTGFCYQEYMTREFYRAANDYEQWIRDNRRTSLYNLNRTSSRNYPRRRFVPSNNRAQTLQTLRNRESRVPHSQRASYRDLIAVLNRLPSYDDLHWIDMAPEIAKQYCSGNVVDLQVGAGPQVIFEVQPTASVEFKMSRQFQNPQNWKNETVFARRPITFFIGWVPVFMSLELLWSSEVKVQMTGGMKATATFPTRRTTIDFYHGLKYPPTNRGACSSGNRCPNGGTCTNGRCIDYFQTLRDIEPGRSNQIELFERTSPNKVRFEVEASVGGEISFSSGPQLNVKFYETVGLGVELAGSAKAKLNVSGTNHTPAQCTSNVEIGLTFKGVGEVEIPLCPADACKMSGEIEIYNSCTHGPQALCTKFDLPTCPPTRNTASTRGGSASNASSSLVSVSFPPGANDVEGAYELDALFVQRGNRRILPVEVVGLMPGQCTAERGTVERGCPELLWEADFLECNPDKWADHVALIPDLDAFAVRFKESLEDGDILHVIRQAVPANELNEAGQNCAASGQANFSIGLKRADGSTVVGAPVATSVYNTNAYRIDVEHLLNEVVLPEDQGWTYVGQDGDYGDWEPPTTD